MNMIADETTLRRAWKADAAAYKRKSTKQQDRDNAFAFQLERSERIEREAGKRRIKGVEETDARILRAMSTSAPMHAGMIAGRIGGSKTNISERLRHLLAAGKIAPAGAGLDEFRNKIFVKLHSDVAK